ncbi:MAG: VCBS repeat-containing protein [Acidobacteria bacterium]|nr:VCBS repeat-containing protein [Acidobacteriota bacterium]MCI0723999.1 VCBS repeat-containing protein [Acidobacteriota bacterium]
MKKNFLWGAAALTLISGFMLTSTLSSSSQRAGKIQWTHLSSSHGDLPAPDVGSQVATLILDIDKDGVNDFVIAGWGKPSMVWYRRGQQGWTRYLIESGLEYIEAGGDSFDIDRDGDLDIVQGGDWRTLKEVWWWENPNPDFQPDAPWKRHYVKNSDEGGKSHHDQIFGDFDGDGKTELACWNQAAGKLLLASIPTDPRKAKSWPLTAIFQFTPPAQGKYEGLAKGDIDLDGKLDIAGAGHWFRHEGRDRFSAHVIDANHYSSRSGVGDLKKGGRPEVVLSPGDVVGPLNWYEWNGHGWTKHTLVEEVTHGHTLQVVDVDGDGNLDIFCAEMREWAGGKGQNPDSKMWVFYGDGKGNFTQTVVSEGIGSHESKVGDLDGDGDPDILHKPFEWQMPRIDIWLQNGTGKPR